MSAFNLSKTAREKTILTFLVVLLFASVASSVHGQPLQTSLVREEIISQSGQISLTFSIALNLGVKDNLIDLPGFTNSGQPGDPSLPNQELTFLLPADADGSGLSVKVLDPKWESVSKTADIVPVPPPVTWGEDRQAVVSWGLKDPKNIQNGRDQTIYGQDAVFPADPIVQTTFERYRRWKLARTQFYPVRWNPASGLLEQLTAGRVVVSFPQKSSAREDFPTTDPQKLQERFNRIKDQLENPGDLKSFYDTSAKDTGPAPSPVTADYVIITTNWIVSNSSQLSNFVSHKTSKGFSVSVITEHGTTADDTHYVSGFSCAQRCNNIRTWLKNNYSPSIDYVLLVGDPHPTTYNSNYSIPMMLCFPDPTNHTSSGGATSRGDVPTDLCYGELSGNWDIDGDGYPGEYGAGSTHDFAAGGIDQTPEVIVGRIPYYGAGSTVTLDSILQKIVNYESTTASTAWRQKLLIPSAVSNFEDDNFPYGNFQAQEDTSPRTLGDGYGETIKSLATSYGYSPYTLYEKTGCKADGTAYPLTVCNAALNQTNLQNEWQNTYGFVSWWGHGSNTAVFRKVWANEGHTADNLCQIGQEDSWSAFWAYTNCGTLNDSYPSFVFQSSCQNGWPEDTNNLGTALLQQGAIATISAARVSWYAVGTWGTYLGAAVSDNTSFCYFSFDRMAGSNDTVGEALNWCRSNFGLSSWGWNSWMNHLDFNLYGSPDTSQNDVGSSAPNAPTNPGSDNNQLTSSNIRWTWTASATPPSITGYKVYADPGLGAPTTQVTTVGSSQTYYDYSAGMPNSQHTFQVCSTDGTTDSAKTSPLTKSSAIETPNSLSFSNIQIDNISVTAGSASGLFSNLTAGLSGIQYTNVTAGGLSSPWLQTTNAFNFGPGMLINTSYTFTAKARNADGVETSATSPQSRYTAIEPVMGLNIHGITQTSITLDVQGAFTNLASGQSGVQVTNQTTTGNSGWMQAPNPWTDNLLSPNTQYSYSGKSRNGDALETTPVPSVAIYTLANPASAPSVVNPTTTSLDISINTSDGNPSHTTYAIEIDPDVAGNNWVQSDGQVGPAPSAFTAANWGTTTVTNLLPDTEYSFYVTAYNGDNIPSASSTAGTATTLSDVTYTVTFETDGTAGSSLQGATTQVVAAGADCSAVTAVAPLNYRFVKWASGTMDVSTDNPIIVQNVTESFMLTAHFALQTYTVDFQTDGTVGSSLQGDSNQVVASGADCTDVTAVAPLDYHFLKWTKDGLDYSTDNPLSITGVSADMQLVAHFAVDNCTVVFQTDGTAGAGLIGNATQVVAYGADCSPVTATTPLDYVFVNWTLNGVPISTSHTVTITSVTEDLLVIANFASNQFTVQFGTDSTPGATLVGNTSQTITAGADCAAVTAVAPLSHHFVKWTKDGADYSTDNPLVVTGVSESMTLVAEFAVNQYTLTYSADSNGRIIGPSPQTVDYGDDGEEVLARPDNGCRFVQWSDGSTENPRQDTNITEDIDVTATFSCSGSSAVEQWQRYE